MIGARGPVSISTRIVVVSTVASTLLLGSLGLFLDGLFSTYQRRQYRALISARIQYIHAELASVGTAGSDDPEAEEIEEIRVVLEKQNRSQESDRFFAQIFDGDGRSMMTTGGMEEALGPAPSFPRPATNVRSIEIRHLERPGNVHLLLTSTRITTKAGVRTVNAVLDWSAEQEMLRALRRASVAALLLGAMLSAFTASRIARRALLPVRELARAADRIEATRLGEPLDTRTAPRELRDLAVALASMQRRLDTSFTRLSAFAGDLAHELRTPLHNLMGELSVALSRDRTGEEYRDVVGSALEECERLARTIDSLLFLARADRGAVQLRATEFDVRAEVEALLEYFRVVAEERTMTMSLHGSARLHADRELVRQAVANLLANAVHYSREGGTIVTTIRDERGRVVIEVRDDGPGIAEDDAARAFDRFFRGSGARRAHPEGSGLGLSIVRSIASLHAGDASVEPGREGGTVARISFPAGDAPGRPEGPD